MICITKVDLERGGSPYEYVVTPKMTGALRMKKCCL